jgi:hypothetical protein
MSQEIFVFASNLAGKHHGGSARRAWERCGAIFGKGEGLQGESYAIPTLDENFEKLPLERIRFYVDTFLVFASHHPEMTFNIVAIGCGIAGFKPDEIAPFFEGCPDNCNLPEEFTAILNKEAA